MTLWIAWYLPICMLALGEPPCGTYDSVVDLASLDGADGVTLPGLEWLFGTSVADLGDVNGDGIDDFIVGAPYQDDHEPRAHVVFGSPNLTDANSLDPDSLDGTNGFVIHATPDDRIFGYSVAGPGDINGDGLDDIFIASISDSTNDGRFYVLFGAANLGSTGSFDPATLDGSNGFTIHTPPAVGTIFNGRRIGGAGDINADGSPDLLIGNLLEDRVYAIFGGKGVGKDGDFHVDELDGTNGFVIEGPSGSDTGECVASAGDFNGDGIDDFVVGAPDYATAVIFGSPDVGRDGVMTLANLEAVQGFLIETDIYGHQPPLNDLGYAAGGHGDFDGDGFDDLVLGDPFTSSPGNSGAGSILLLRGGSDYGLDGPLVITLSNLEDDRWTLLPGPRDENFGRGISLAGDVNADGLADIVVGAYKAPSNGLEWAGKIYVLFGRPGLTALDIDLTNLQPHEGFTVPGIVEATTLGRQVDSRGDYNADGVPDMLLAADGFSEETAVYLLFGMARDIDCDENEVCDYLDVAGGASDCNSNYSPDECDVTNGLSLDRNNNRVPDECETVVHYVKADAAGAGDGSSWKDAYTGLQEAIDAATVLDQVWVAAGAYAATHDTDAAAFSLRSNIGIYGGFAGNEATLQERAGLFEDTILTGEGRHRVVDALFLPSTSVLDGFAIRDGHHGSVLVLMAGSPIVRNSFFESGCPAIEALHSRAVIDTCNIRHSHPGLRATGGRPTVVDTRFECHMAIIAEDAQCYGERILFEDCVGNDSHPGIHALRSELSISDSTFSYEVRDSVILEESTASFQGCAFVGNRKRAIEAKLSEAAFSKCTFTGHVEQASTYVCLDESTGQFDECGFLNNSRSVIFAQRGSTVALKGCTIQDNLVDHVSDSVISLDESIGLIDGCLFQNNAGKALLASHSELTVEGCVFEHNDFALKSIPSQATVRNTVFRNNADTAELTGTVEYCQFLNNQPSFGTLVIESGTVRHSEFIGNRAIGFAGLLCGSGPVDIHDCIMADNEGLALLRSTAPTTRIESCRIIGNRSVAWTMVTNALVMTNTLLAGNSAEQNSAFRAASATITSSTIANNIGTTQGAILSSPLTIDDSIIWGNEPELLANQANPTVSYSTIQEEIPGMAVIHLDPVFEDPDGPDNDPDTWQDNDYRLSASSPCIDTGNPGTIPRKGMTDVDGLPRLVDGDGDRIEVIDMGAFEYQAMCSSFDSCADVDEDGITDDACQWWFCSGGGCHAVERVFGDLGGPFGRCSPDGVADGQDHFHALNCFKNTSTDEVSPYSCEQNAPASYNIDVSGPDQPCAPDGRCDGHDMFAVLDAFSRQSPCSCSGGPAPAMPGKSVTGTAQFSVIPSARVVSPGDVVSIDVFVQTGAPLRGYQLHLDSSAGRAGSLDLIDISINQAESPFLQHDWSAFNIATGQMVAGVDSGARAAHEMSYLATFTYLASPRAAGQFLIDLLANDKEAHRTYLFPENISEEVVGGVSSPVVIEVLASQPGRRR